MLVGQQKLAMQAGCLLLHLLRLNGGKIKPRALTAGGIDQEDQGMDGKAQPPATSVWLR